MKIILNILKHPSLLTYYLKRLFFKSKITFFDKARKEIIISADSRQKAFELEGLNSCDDITWVKLVWLAIFKKNINLKHPKGFNEKLRWLAIYNQNPNYTNLADKVLVRDFVSKSGFADILVPIYGVYDNANDIDFNKLPNKFVLKCNHNSGEGLIVVRNKADLDIKKTREILNAALSHNYYSMWRETQYKNIKPKILIEKLLESKNTNGDLISYNFCCFNGEPKFFYIGVDQASLGGDKNDLALAYYDMNFKPINMERDGYKIYDKPINKPKTFDRMVEIARTLSKGIPFLRVDLYDMDRGGRIYFSELTFTPGAGLSPFKSKKVERKVGSYIKLPKKMI